MTVNSQIQKLNKLIAICEKYPEIREFVKDLQQLESKQFAGWTIVYTNNSEIIRQVRTNITYPLYRQIEKHTPEDAIRAIAILDANGNVREGIFLIFMTDKETAETVLFLQESCSNSTYYSVLKQFAITRASEMGIPLVGVNVNDLDSPPYPHAIATSSNHIMYIINSAQLLFQPPYTKQKLTCEPEKRNTEILPLFKHIMNSTSVVTFQMRNNNAEFQPAEAMLENGSSICLHALPPKAKKIKSKCEV